MSEERTILTAKARKAADAYKAFKKQVEKEAREAADAVRASYREQLRDLSHATYVANNALREHIDATTTHPWEGKKVVRVTHEPVSRWSSKTREVRLYGVVEIRRTDTKFPANQRWGLPDLGDPFVRLLKKDGTPSLKLDRWNWRVTDQWKLAEEVAA